MFDVCGQLSIFQWSGFKLAWQMVTNLVNFLSLRRRQFTQCNAGKLSLPGIIFFELLHFLHSQRNVQIGADQRRSSLLFMHFTSNLNGCQEYAYWLFPFRFRSKVKELFQHSELRRNGRRTCIENNKLNKFKESHTQQQKYCWAKYKNTRNIRYKERGKVVQGPVLI